LRWPWQQEVRTVPETEVAADLLQALINPGLLTKGQAISIPTVLSCVNFVADIVSMMPIKLYKDTGEQAIEVKEDLRVKLLNDDPGDTLDSVQFWRAIIRDYYLGKGGYVYINREFNTIKSLHYVKEENVSINKNTDPIFKKYQILVNGINYWPYEFIKILRNTQDGAQGKSVIEESPLILSVVYNALIFEDTLVRKGGNKKGFLKSERRLTEAAIETLKQAWRNLYSNNSDNVVVLNEGLEFQEASNTSVEMQLNENKSTNSAEICKVFNIAENVIRGAGSSKEYTNSFKMAVLPVLSAIENALNRELLLEDEKGSYYFAFDTKEMLKGDIKERFEAYRTAIDANFMGVDEVRYLEDLPSLGIDWIKLGLDSVLYDVKNKTIYTPNTNQTSKINDMKGGEENQS
jgi:HK97 family phage portal protein